jgi:hypothetical protein
MERQQARPDAQTIAGMYLDVKINVRPTGMA